MARHKHLTKSNALKHGGKLCPSCLGVFTGAYQYEQHIGQPNSRCHHILWERLRVVNADVRRRIEHSPINELEQEVPVSSDEVGMDFTIAPGL